MPVESMRGSRQGLETGADGEKFAADGAGAGVGLAGLDQVADEAGFSRTSGLSVRTHRAELARMALILRLGKAQVLCGSELPGCVLQIPRDQRGCRPWRRCRRR